MVGKNQIQAIKKKGVLAIALIKMGRIKAEEVRRQALVGLIVGAGVMVAGIVVALVKALVLALEKAIKEVEASLEGRLVGAQALAKRVGDKNQEIDKTQKMGEDKSSEFKNIF